MIRDPLASPSNSQSAVNVTSITASVSVITPIVDSGAGSLVLKGAGTTALTATGANLVAAGTLSCTTLTATTSVVTPLIGTDAAVQLDFKTSGSVRWIISGTGFLIPATDNTLNLGAGSFRIATIFTPIIDTGTTGSGILKTNVGTTVLTWANDLSVTVAGVLSIGGVLNVSAVQVVSTRRTGWSATTGSEIRTNFGDASLTDTSQALRALVVDLKAHGLIGA